MFKYSYSRYQYVEPTKYTINFTGTIQDGDSIDLAISRQMVDGQPVSYLYIPQEFNNIEIDKSSTEFTTGIRVFEDISEERFLAVFDLTISVIRNHEIIYRTTISNFEFCDETPTFDEMFAVKQQGETYVLQGFDDKKPWVPYQASICDVLLPPSNTTEIEANAFYKNNQTTIPESIQLINLVTNNIYLGTKNNLECIREGAFAYSQASMLVLPSTLSRIETGAFESCTNLKIIDVSNMINIPLSWEDDAFKGVKSPEGQQKGIVIVDKSTSINKWQSYFIDHESNSDISNWQYVSIK